MTTIDPSAPLTPWTDAERVAFIRQQEYVAEQRIKARAGHSRKLTQEDADRIRIVYRTTRVSQMDLANYYGVSQPTIGKILANEHYRSAA